MNLEKLLHLSEPFFSSEKWDQICLLLQAVLSIKLKKKSACLMPSIVVGSEDTEAIFMKAIVPFINDYANECLLFLRMLKVGLIFTKKI